MAAVLRMTLTSKKAIWSSACFWESIGQEAETVESLTCTKVNVISIYFY